MALSEEKRETIRALLATGLNKDAIAKTAKVSWDTVNRIALEEPDKFEEIRDNKKKQFIEDMWDDMRAARRLGRQKIDLATVALDEFQPTIDKLIELLSEKDDIKGGDIVEVVRALSSVTNIPLGQISTYLGTLYDKQALMNNESTANTTTVVKLAGELEAWAN